MDTQGLFPDGLQMLLSELQRNGAMQSHEDFG
jgi:hypothetical protein